jgi:CHAD domain-containing protein
VKCPDRDETATVSRLEFRDVCTLEAYAEAVRAYQEIVLELQDMSSTNSDVLGAVLQKAEAAKEAVKRYRASYYAR